MINVSINAGSSSGSGSPIKGLIDLQILFETMPDAIRQANELAKQQAVDDVKDNIEKRSKSIGQFINVEARKYGDIGFQLRIGPSAGGSGGSSGGSSRKYNLQYATRIFLDSEMGKVGRVGFTLKQREGGKPYKVSHASGSFTEGFFFQGPATIPEIGAFHFSSKSGVEHQPINKYASERIIKYLNLRYRSILQKDRRSRGLF